MTVSWKKTGSVSVRAVLRGYHQISWGLATFVGITMSMQLGVASGHAAAETSGILSLRRFELLDHLSGAKESSEINAYLAAVVDTFEITNTVLATSQKERLFCPDMPLNVPLMRRLLRERIAFLSRLGQDTEDVKARSGIVIVLLQALREKYPCH